MGLSVISAHLIPAVIRLHSQLLWVSLCVSCVSSFIESFSHFSAPAHGLLSCLQRSLLAPCNFIKWFLTPAAAVNTCSDVHSSSVHGIFQARTLEWLPCPPPGDRPNPGIEHLSPTSPALHADSLPIESPGKPLFQYMCRKSQDFIRVPTTPACQESVHVCGKDSPAWKPS